MATLPPAHLTGVLQKIISHPQVWGVRYNTGVSSAYNAQETLQRIQDLTDHHNKPFYVDLKGRQLRIKEWSTLPYGPIILNHNIKVELPAKVLFRGDDCCNLVEVVDGNKIYVDPLPRYPVGRGQSVNILSSDLSVQDNFTQSDIEFIAAAAKLGIKRFMLSFTESSDDLIEFASLLEDYQGDLEELVLKIESVKGLDFARKSNIYKPYRLMAARDDLMIEIGINNMLSAISAIVKKDKDAICASQILLSLEHGSIKMTDVSDLELMTRLGFKTFMLSDEICRNHFDEAMDFWAKWSKSKF